jgi:nucleoside-diphosphate-sugar epimerase
MKIGILGFGWLGRPLGLKLQSAGFEVVGSTTSAEKITNLASVGLSAFQLHLPLKDDSVIRTQLTNCDWVVITIPPSGLGDHYSAGLKSLAECFDPSTKVIFTSSTSVYDDINDEVDETSPFVGSSARGKVVHEAELALREVLANRLTVLRLGGLYGAQRHPVKFMQGRDYPDGEAPVNMASLDLCIQAIHTVIAQNIKGELINVWVF